MSGTIQNQQEYRKLFNDYYAVLCNFLYRYVQDRDTCEDLVQSVFVKLWENRSSIVIEGSMKSYLFTAARNAAFDYIRAQKRKDAMLEDQGEPEPEAPADIDQEASQTIFKQRLYDAIQSLKPKTRQIFVLHKIEGLTYQEISDHLNIPKRTIEYNIYAALAKLKEELSSEYKQLMSQA